MVQWLCFIRGCSVAWKQAPPVEIQCVHFRFSVAQQTNRRLKRAIFATRVYRFQQFYWEKLWSLPLPHQPVLNKNNSQRLAFSVRQVKTWDPVSPSTIEQQQIYLCWLFPRAVFETCKYSLRVSIWAFSQNDSAFFSSPDKKKWLRKTSELNHQNFGVGCFF